MIHPAPDGTLCVGEFEPTGRKAKVWTSSNTDTNPPPWAPEMPVVKCKVCGVETLGYTEEK